MSQNESRRNFLRAVPVAAAFGLSFDRSMVAAEPAAIGAVADPAAPIQFFPAAKLEDDRKALHKTPGNNNLVDAKSLPFTVVMTVEEKKAAKEFEWHEGRDHILQILEGATVYELGGAPQGAHNTKPGEWLAPSSTGAATMTLNKGDMLVIPRGTPHKRTTDASVTFILISTTGSAPA